MAAAAPSDILVGAGMAQGWPAGAPYDLILIDGAVRDIPVTLANQLNRQSGRLITIISEGEHSGHAILAEPTPAGVSFRALFDCVSPVLPAFTAVPSFEF